MNPDILFYKLLILMQKYYLNPSSEGIWIPQERRGGAPRAPPIFRGNISSKIFFSSCGQSTSNFWLPKKGIVIEI